MMDLNKVAERLRKIKPSGIRKFFDIVQEKEGVISLGVGEPDFPTPWHIIEEAFYYMERGETHYTSNNGLLELRERVSEYLGKYNLDYAPNEIIATVGGSEGIDLALRTLINPGDEIILPEPVYVPYKPLGTLQGAKIVSINTEKTDFKLTPEDLEKNITEKTKAVVLNYPNNPTGKTLTRRELEKLADVIIKKDILCITDEIYSELTYEHQHNSIASIDGMKERTIYLNGFSKAFSMTGWRIGYLAAPKNLIDQIIKIHQYTTLCAPIMSQYGAIEALKNGMKNVEKMRGSYNRRRRLISKSLQDAGLEVSESKGAMYVYPSVKSTGLTGEEFAVQLLEAKNVAVVPGTAFGEDFKYHIRCSYATSIEEIKLAVTKIAEFVKELKDKKS
ncbi:MAG: pyridoxal phosphate-dependent aminotransferase [Fusobacteriota bacterium]